MPPFNPHHRLWWILVAVLTTVQMAVVSRPAAAQSANLVSVRAREVELHYRVTGATGAEVELWYTRDRGISWQSAGRDGDGVSPFVFTAPGEGLYGLMFIACLDGRPVRPAPKSHETPQRWVFVDATPPLAQWDGVEPADDFATNRRLQLRWTAYDDNLSPWPVKLLYQSSIDQQWQMIAEQATNTGVYDWTVPESVGGQITLKLLVSDQGGHMVERPFGPVSLEKMVAVGGPAKETPRAVHAESQPALASNSLALRRPGLLPDTDAVSTRPALMMPTRVDLLKQRLAADLYRQGTWHLVRGQYGVAAERIQEAIDQDPDLLDARQDLAGIFYRQQDYDRAIKEYQTVLDKNANNETALYGAALAYVAKRDYHHSREMLTRLLAVNKGNAEAWLDLGDVLFMMGDTINARANWRQAAKVDATATEIVKKAQLRLEQYGADELVQK